MFLKKWNEGERGRTSLGPPTLSISNPLVRVSIFVNAYETQESDTNELN